MRVKLRALPGIPSGEEASVSMLLTQSVFLGIFFGTFNIVAWTHLLSTFDGKILGPALLVSGITGIFFIFLYRKLRSVFKSGLFSLANLIFSDLLTIILCLVLHIISWQWVPMVLFAMSVPITMLVLFSFRENEIQLLKIYKDYSVSAERSLIAGIVLISFLIPMLLYLQFSLMAIMLISPFSLTAAVVLQNFMPIRPFEPSVYEIKSAGKFQNKSSHLLIIIFACTSVAVAFIIQYLLMSVARMQLLVDNDMAVFLGFFTAGILLLYLAGKSFIFPFILQNYRLKSGLLLPPFIIAIVIIILTVLRLAIGINAVTFPEFFIFIVLAGLLSFTMILSVGFPSLRIIIKALGNNAEDILQDGYSRVVLPGLLISGLILTVTGLFFPGLIAFLLLLIPVIILWLYFAFKVYDLYRNQIVSGIDKDGAGIDTTGVQNNLKNRFSGQLLFKANYFKLICGDYAVLNSTTNKWYFEEIIENAWSKKDINLLPVLKKISIIDGLDEGIRKQSSEVLNILQKKTVFFKYNDEKIAEAVRILSGTRIPQTTQILSLLRDKSIESKKLALYLIGKFGLVDLLSVVCDCLSNPLLSVEAYTVLESFGRDAEEELIRFYLISSGNTKLSRTVIQLLQKIKTRETANFLFSRLGSNSRQLKETVLRYLLENEFKPTEKEIQKLEHLASDTIGILTWNLSAKASLRQNEDDILSEILAIETERWETFLFNTLSVIYGKGIIQKVSQGMSDRSFERASLNAENIDLLITGPVRPKLSAYFAFPDKIRLEKLFQFYPGEITTKGRLLEDIINRDYNLVGLWTKASALSCITGIEGDDMIQSVTALLFSQEEIIQEETGRLIARTKPEIYRMASSRLPDATRYRLDGIIEGTTDIRLLLYEKVKFLKKLLPGIPEDELLPLAIDMSYLKYFDSEVINTADGCILWPLGEKGNEPHIFYKGETEIIARKLRNWESFYMLTLTAIENYHFRFPEQASAILKYIDEKQS